MCEIFFCGAGWAGGKESAGNAGQGLSYSSSITDMLEELNWESLESRRTKIQLTLLYKIMNGMVDIPTSPYVTQASARTRSSHTMKLRQISSRTDAYKYSFFPRTIPFWNSLPASIAEAPDLVSFKRELSTLTF